MAVKRNLEKLGFSPQEVSAYLALLGVGESSVGGIIEKTGFHREIVYGCLKRLEQRGYIQSLEKRNIRHYQIIDPKIIKRKVEERVKIADLVVPELESLLTKPEVMINVFEGKKGFEEAEKDWADSLKDGEEFYCIGGAGKAWYDIAKDFYKTYHKKLVKRGIKLKTVTFPSEIEGITENELPEFNELRVLAQDLKPPSSTVIYADKILIQVFGEKPIAVMIQSQFIAKAYEAYFQILWQMGKPVE